MSDKCKHGIRDTATNLPYCRRCDEGAKSELVASRLLAARVVVNQDLVKDNCCKGCSNCKHMKVWPGSEPCSGCNQLYPEIDAKENTANHWEAE